MIIKEQKRNRPIFVIESTEDAIDLVSSLMVWVTKDDHKPTLPPFDFDKLLGKVVFGFSLYSGVIDTIKENNQGSIPESEVLLKESMDKVFSDKNKNSENVQKRAIDSFLNCLEHLFQSRDNPLVLAIRKSSNPKKVLDLMSKIEDREIVWSALKAEGVVDPKLAEQAEQFLKNQKFSISFLRQTTSVDFFNEEEE